MTNAQKTGGATDAASLTERAREAASSAGEKVAAAASSTVEAAKERPYAAVGIVAGVAAAVGGVAYAATKLGGSTDDGPGSRPKSAQ